MNERQRVLAVLNYEEYDRLPLVHFGFWYPETLQRWVIEGHLSPQEVEGWSDGNAVDRAIGKRLGFDLNWATVFSPNCWLHPSFEPEIIAEFSDGTQHYLNADGVIVLQRLDATSIPAEIDHTLKDRKTWEEHYWWRFDFAPERVTKALVQTGSDCVPFDRGGLEFLRSDCRDFFYGLHCGSLFGLIRNLIGLEEVSYLAVDDEALLDEIIATAADLVYRTVEFTLESGARFDFAHFWEDICFKSGPLVSPRLFQTKIGPQYRRITDLLNKHGIEIVSVDCDGKINALIPSWLGGGVNTMFPIEIGTWNADFGLWREQYGRQLRGVGGMNKVAFSRDREAIDAEVERLKSWVDLGGFLPCPDHRIPPDAEWDLVRYYTDRMRQVFG